MNRLVASLTCLLCLSGHWEPVSAKVIADSDTFVTYSRRDLDQRPERGAENLQPHDESTLQNFQRMYKFPVSDLETLSAQGDAFATYVLGWKYYQGDEVQKDLRKFFELNLKAAEQGIASSQIFVAGAYLTGEGTEINKPERIKWLRRVLARADSFGHCDLQSSSAWWKTSNDEQGETTERVLKCIVNAEIMLAYTYQYGDGITKDLSQAIHWWRKAADRGDLFSQMQLGFLYAEGRDVRIDYAEACRWFQKASDQGSVNARQLFDYYHGKATAVSEVLCVLDKQSDF